MAFLVLRCVVLPWHGGSRGEVRGPSGSKGVREGPHECGDVLHFRSEVTNSGRISHGSHCNLCMCGQSDIKETRSSKAQFNLD